MYVVDLTKFGIKKNEMVEFDTLLRRFYRRVLYTNAQYKNFMLTFDNIVENNPNGKIKFGILKEYLRNIIEMDTEPSKKHIIKKAIGAIYATYEHDNVFFEKAQEGGAQNFAYYIELLMASVYESNKTILLFYKEELAKTIQSMEEIRYFTHHAPSI